MMSEDKGKPLSQRVKKWFNKPGRFFFDHELADSNKFMDEVGALEATEK